jgi:hypothetical protein
MLFKPHSDFKGAHALLSPSNYHWVNYTEDKMDRVFFAQQAARRGDELHAFAGQAIKLGIRLPKSTATLHAYVNDSIGYRMIPEQVLWYSPEAFGTTDAICFRRNQLRIHDLKTGVTPASMTQLEIYAALFCLEYRVKPFDISTELRIYQNDTMMVHTPDADSLYHLMDKIVSFSRRIQELRLEET